MDDDPDITFTFGFALEGYYYQDNEKRRFEVYTHNDPEVALSKFKRNFYDLLLTDIFMPKMNGLELYQKIVEIDPNIRTCFMSSAEINIEALREVYPNVSFGCFIQKPVTIDKLVKRLLAELDGWFIDRFNTIMRYTIGCQEKLDKGRKRILLVDDDPDNNRIFTIALRDSGFEVDSFEDPRLALSTFKTNYYDLVMLDIRY